MTKEENYNEFDTTSIVSKDTVSIGKLTVRKRELIYGAIAIFALIIVIILVIVLAVEVGNCHSASSSSVGKPATDSQTGTGDNSTGGGGDSTDDSIHCNVSGTDFCNTVPCLKTAYYEKSIMNENVDPCNNFYQFACGGYAAMYPQSPVLPDQNPYDQIMQENLQKLIYLLQYQPERLEEHSYERKLRHFIKSCTNHFDKMELRGQPFLEKVLKTFGGWSLLGNWTPSTFNLQDKLKAVHSDFWTSAFFSLGLSTDAYDWNKKVLEVSPGGLGLAVAYYNYKFFIDTYKEYIKKLANYIARDAGVKVNESQIIEFVDDVLDVEYSIVQAVYNSSYQTDPHAPANRINLGTLSQLTNYTLNFVDYFSYTFPDPRIKFTEDTTVSVLFQRYFHNLGPKLHNYTSTDDGKRKLHNYLVWQMLSNYARYLSWDYVHAVRQIIYSLTYQKDSSSGFYDCFRQAEDTMNEAMGAVFLKEYVNQKDKQEAMDILSNIKDILIHKLESATWMSDDNRRDAVTKIKDSLYKIGNPDYMINETYMDNLYRIVNISDDDYFGNALSLNALRKREFINMLAVQDSKTNWVYPVMMPVIEYYNPWHELIATAGILQYPLFSHNGPNYYNYGGIGTLLGSHLLNAVNEYGSKFKLDKSNHGNWWTNFTQERYLLHKECAMSVIKNKQLGPFNVSGLPVPNMTREAAYLAPELLTETTGLRLSLEAFKMKRAKTGTEKIPAGLPNYSSEQLFFIAYGQAYCHNTPEFTLARNYYIKSKVPGDYRVNVAVAQIPEFRKAFNCLAGTPMAAEKDCSLF